MSEEQKPLSPNPNPSEGKRQAPSRQVRRSPKSVFQYLAILFAAAFVLLLFTFAMEKRQYQIMQEQSEEQIDDLQQSSISAVNSLNNLLKENETPWWITFTRLSRAAYSSQIAPDASGEPSSIRMTSSFS